MAKFVNEAFVKNTPRIRGESYADLRKVANEQSPVSTRDMIKATSPAKDMDRLPNMGKKNGK